MRNSKRRKQSLPQSIWSRIRPRQQWIPYIILMGALIALNMFRIDLSGESIFVWGGWESNLGRAIAIMLIVGLWGFYLNLRRPGLMRQRRVLYFLIGVMITVALIGRAVDLLAPFLVLSEQAAFLVPVAFGAGLVTIFVGAEVGMSLVILLAFVVGISSAVPTIKIPGGLDTGVTELFRGGINPVAIFAALGSGAAAVFRCAQLRRLSELPLVGLQIGLFGAILLLGSGVVFYGSIGSFQPHAVALIWVALTGLISALLIFGGLPLGEFITQKTSPLGLVELLNPSNPLLTMLRREAPGTYHHSISVADLAESAAQEIGADPLLTKVGAYYHDIGKIRRPEFFIENQSGSENPHDSVSPSMSKMILTSHIKDGVDLAREYGLREDIIQFITQHHGTAMIRFFYFKALKEGKITEDNIDDFRYDTDLPTSKETALVMLADSVQAASTSLENASELQEMIHNVMRIPLDDGQLSDSPLTLRDLELIEKSFFKTLRAMRHDRSGSFPKEQSEKALKPAEEKPTDEASTTEQATLDESDRSELSHPNGTSTTPENSDSDRQP